METSFAFQPIVDISTGAVFAYEALVRGSANEPAGAVFASLPEGMLHVFDRDARKRAIALAAGLGISCSLSLNFLPQTLDTLPDAVSSTVESAIAWGLTPDKLILEVTEGEIIHHPARFASRMNEWRTSGMRLAIDDFGAGYSGLNLLAEFQPDIVKIDMQLVRAIEGNGPRQAIVRAVLQACNDLGLEVIAEGIETEAEFDWFRRHGTVLLQGFFLGRPLFEQLGDVDRRRIECQQSARR